MTVEAGEVQGNIVEEGKEEGESLLFGGDEVGVGVREKGGKAMDLIFNIGKVEIRSMPIEGFYKSAIFNRMKERF